CFRAYASIRLLPDKLQGSILGPWLAVTQVGLTPTKVHGIAKPQLSPLFAISFAPHRFGYTCNRNGFN
ncbi:MAG: hypothetical protein ACHBNF_01025, partial [Chromatiales bacterium]